MTIVGVAFTGADALRGYEQLRPDVTFLDVDLGSEAGFADFTFGLGYRHR